MNWNNWTKRNNWRIRNNRTNWNKWKSRIKIIALTVAVLWSSMFLPFEKNNVNAATHRLDTIRVALFIQTRDMTPTVTISHPETAYIGIRTPGGIRNWLRATNGEAVRFSVDQFRLNVYESSDLGTAKAVASELSAIMTSRERAFVFETKRGEDTVYQVVAGNYTSLQEATNAMDRLLVNSAISLPDDFAPQIKGPHHLSAGIFVEEGEAYMTRARYQQLGLDAEIVYLENGNQELVYAVWIGDESTAENLESVRYVAQALVPEIELVDIDPSIPYLYSRVDYSGSAPIRHYFYNPNNQKVWITSDTPGIRVHERSNRTYRGHMELSQYNGRLALVNEVDFEQYLYAVVSNEMGGSFPLEALKAQAVAARTYALQQGMKYQIAHISDTVYDQVYYGYGSEIPAARQAVDATASEVVVNATDHSLITPYYSSNSGGFTSETDEVWGTSVPYLHSVPSPDDIAEIGKHMWYRVVLPSGMLGYVRHDLVTVSGATANGLYEVTVIEDRVNIRPSPDTGYAAITQVTKGQKLIVLESVIESNPYSWTSPMWSADVMKNRINQYVRTPISGELRSLEIAERGNSGRVVSVVANGSQRLDVSYPDAFRTVLNGLRSTRFDIDQTNDLTILGTQGVSVNVKNLDGQNQQLYALSAHSSEPVPVQGEYLITMNQNQKVRVATLEPAYRFIGRGYGHGLGMSQYGAKALAELGYDYQRILQYYYKNVKVIKG